MRVCDLCLGTGSSEDVELGKVGGAERAIAQGDLCDDCVSALQRAGLAQGIAERFAQRPRRRSPVKQAKDKAAAKSPGAVEQR